MICRYMPFTICAKVQLSVILGWREKAFRRHPICNPRPVWLAWQLKLTIFDLSHSKFWFYSFVVKTWSVGTCLETIFTKFQLSNMLFSIFMTPCHFSTAIFWQHVVHCPWLLLAFLISSCIFHPALLSWFKVLECFFVWMFCCLRNRYFDRSILTTTSFESFLKCLFIFFHSFNIYLHCHRFGTLLGNSLCL